MSTARLPEEPPTALDLVVMTVFVEVCCSCPELPFTGVGMFVTVEKLLSVVVMVTMLGAVNERCFEMLLTTPRPTEAPITANAMITARSTESTTFLDELILLGIAFGEY